MLARMTSRLARPTLQAARKGSIPPSARFTTRAAAQRDSGNLPARGATGRGRNTSLQHSPAAGYSPALRPLATDLFFPAQVGSLFRDIESELARLWGNEGQAIAKTALGQVDIKETKSEFIFKLDAPGLSKDDIQVRVTPDNLLIISGERVKEEEDDEDDTGFHRVERVFGKFQRRFQLPDNVDPTRIKADVKNGVLTVVVPKREHEAEQPQHSEIPVTDASAVGQEASAV